MDYYGRTDLAEADKLLWLMFCGTKWIAFQEVDLKLPAPSGMHLATASERCQLLSGASLLYAREYALNTPGKLADEIP